MATGKILAVDDDLQIVAMLKMFLSSRGYEVCGICDPSKGVATFSTFRPDVCVLDFRMPRFTGADLLKQFQTIDSTVEIIFLTAETETALVIGLLKVGAIDYLVKPINVGALEASVDRAFEHRRLVLENIEYREHLEQLVEEKTGALNNALHSLATMYSATIDTLGTALDFRDQSTSGHSRRVSRWTTEIARRIGIAGEELKQVEQGSLLHDIGKLKIPDSILLKPGPLTAAEWQIMRRHAEYGKKFLEHIDLLRAASEIVYTHHEKFDGSGYPQGLQGKAIPIGSRCFAIVDAIDAMTFKRPYNQPISFEQAAAEVHRCAGKHFDADLIQIALDFLAEDLMDRSNAKGFVSQEFQERRAASK